VWLYEGKSTRPFLRGREFMWIESHNVFGTLEEAKAQTREDMRISRNVMWEQFGIPFIQFKRPEWDKFCGSVFSYAADTLMPDGKFLQLPSTHLLGDNFSKAFNIYYTDQEGNKKVTYQTCYGPAISRIFGAMVAVHGDDNGLIFPFEVAPLQIVIIPIPTKGTIEDIIDYCQELEQELAERGYRVKTDLGDERPGDKYFFWEMKGVPLRLEIGQREANTEGVTIFRRDTREKQTLSQEEFLSIVDVLGAKITINLKTRAEEEFKRRLVIAKNWKELEKAIVNRKVVKIAFCSIEAEGKECAMAIKDNLAATVRGTDVQEIDAGIVPKKSENCLICGKPAQCYVYVGKQY
ncbi:MAG: His/Gly/Thr/Pro-type tRNA ligase C-terminal domain-containing protein, partial [Promethearchaeota archaeon]